jgi:hypothetical protein
LEDTWDVLVVVRRADVRPLLCDDGDSELVFLVEVNLDVFVETVGFLLVVLEWDEPDVRLDLCELVEGVALLDRDVDGLRVEAEVLLVELEECCPFVLLSVGRDNDPEFDFEFEVLGFRVELVVRGGASVELDLLKLEKACFLLVLIVCEDGDFELVPVLVSVGRLEEDELRRFEVDETIRTEVEVLELELFRLDEVACDMVDELGLWDPEALELLMVLVAWVKLWDDVVLSTRDELTGWVDERVDECVADFVVLLTELWGLDVETKLVREVLAVCFEEVVFDVELERLEALLKEVGDVRDEVGDLLVELGFVVADEACPDVLDLCELGLETLELLLVCKGEAVAELVLRVVLLRDVVVGPYSDGMVKVDGLCDVL